MYSLVFTSAVIVGFGCIGKNGDDGMSEKRFTLEMQYWKGNPQGRKLFDNLTGQDGMSVEELCNIASALHCKCEELKIVLEVYEDSLNKLEKENKELKASLYAEKTNTAEVVNDYAKQFKRHSAQFSFMIDLAEDLGVDIKKLEALDD